MIDEVIQLLNEAVEILSANTPDMDIAEWNATPAGRAIRKIEAAAARLIGEDE